MKLYESIHNMLLAKDCYCGNSGNSLSEETRALLTPVCCGVVVLCSEQQPRVRGWLLASVDGQTSGLVPANYVKVLGKRRGRKHAEAERLVQVQQNHTEALQTGAVAQGISSASNTDASDMLLEAVFAESPAPNSSTELNIPAKTDL